MAQLTEKVTETANGYEVTIHLQVSKTLLQDLKCICGIDPMKELRDILGAEVVGTLENYLLGKEQEIKRLLEP